MTENRTIVADSSFYLCFIEDIHNPEPMLEMFNRFLFATTPEINEEVCRCRRYGAVKGKMKVILMTMSLPMTEILKPFFSKAEIDRGETTIISLAFHLLQANAIHSLIIDEEKARKFVENILESLRPVLTGTLGFIGTCFCDYALFERQYALNLLNEIEHSPFRVSSNILSSVASRIKTCR